MKIKVCGLREEQNITEVVGLQPDFVGFIFYPHSRRFVEDDGKLSAYMSRMEQVKKVGVFVNEQTDVILSKVAVYHLDIVQLHGQETPETCRELASHLPVWKAFPIDDKFDFGLLSAYQSYCQYFLFDTPSPLHGGSGQSFDWNNLQLDLISLPFFLSGGISPGDIGKITRFTHPYFEGVDLNSCFELRPGLKDINLLNTFIHDLRN